MIDATNDMRTSRMEDDSLTEIMQLNIDERNLPVDVENKLVFVGQQ